VPFLRFSRDKRGYENIYLVHTQTRRGKAPRQRILYWYRTPPGVRVGRSPFDEEARRRIEAQNPELTFDWPTIVATPIPPPAENEQWRERRRAERAAKQAQRAEDEAALLNGREATDEPVPAIESESPPTDGDDTPDRPLVADNVREAATVESEPEPGAEGDVTAEIVPEASEATITAVAGDRSLELAARRRRRRGGRRRRGRRGPSPFAEASGQTPTGEGSNPVEPPVQGRESNESFPDSESGEFDANDE
jgi:hypothetical protein